MSLLQPMDQGVIRMFKTHYLQKTWRAFSMKCDASLSELEKATQATMETEVECQKNVVQRHWRGVYHSWRYLACAGCLEGGGRVLHLWGLEKALSSVRRRLQGLRPHREAFREVPQVTQVDEESQAWMSSRKKTSILLETISEELSTEELDELEKQWRQLEEEVEAQQQPLAPSTTKQLMVNILQCFYAKLSDTTDYLGRSTLLLNGQN